MFRKCVLLLFALVVGQNVRAQVMKLWVKENSGNCFSVEKIDCLQVKFDVKDSVWDVLSGIEDFKYEEGYRYILSVKRTNLSPPNVEPDYKFKLLKVISKEKVISAPSAYWSYIYKHNWKLIQLNGVTIPDAKAHINFTELTRSFSGSTGCNRMFGSFATSGDSIRFNAVAATSMACLDNKQSALEAEFLKTLSRQEFTFDVADQVLNFYRDGKIVIMFGVNGDNEK